MKRKSKIWIAVGIIALMCAACCFLVIDYSAGWSEKGVVDEINTLPYFGKFLEGFEVVGNINYQFKKYTRGVNGFFTGQTSTDSFDKFCNQANGWNFLSLDKIIIGNWLNKIKIVELKWDYSFLNDVEENKYAFKEINIDKETIIIEIIFSEKDGKFIAFASKTLPD